MILYLGLIVTVLSGVLSVRNGDIKEGEPCRLQSEKYGRCRKILDCPNLDYDDTASWTFCKPTAFIQVICCPGRKQKREVMPVKAMCAAVPLHDGSRMGTHKSGIAEVAEFPFVGSFMYGDADRKKRCAAALITSKHLITAAHCFRRGNVTEVRLGTDSEYGIARYVLHPDYNRLKSSNDIAVVELDEEVDLNEANVAPLCLHDSTEDLPSDESLTVVGWGWGMTDRDTLQKAAMKPVLRSICETKFARNRFAVSDNHLCAEMKEDSNTDACMGAFGGPLVKLEGNKYHLVGITSYVYGCGLRAYPGVYTRVANYLEWITAQVEARA